MKVIAIAISLLVSGTLFWSHYNHNKKNVFIDGFDVVSYQNSGPEKGSEDFQTEFKRMKFWFKDSANLKKFKLSPNEYIPAYGGWCAYAMAENGDKVSVDPLTYKFVNEKLLLFYNKFGINTLKKWNELPIESEAIDIAENNWEKIKRSE